MVAWSRQITIRRYQDARPWPAQVAFYGHDCDLAVLEVADPAFFESAPPLALGDLPEVRSTVVTYGYPSGGEQISYTRGVVSRIELQNYVHPGNSRLLAVQTDAAINPGNSGGPVIQEDKAVGVAFQGVPGLENTGFFIPSPVFRHFLEDIGDGTYNGFPKAGIRITPLQNPAQRRRLGLGEEDGGARISAISREDTREHLRRNDVLLQIGDWPVDRDGSTLFEGNQLSSGMIFSLAQEGDKVPVRIMREREELLIDLPVRVDRQRASEGNQYHPPRYFIYAGLVFTPLSRDYIGDSSGRSSSSMLIYELHQKRLSAPEEARPEPVMLATVLSHPANANMRIQRNALVDRINEVPIQRLEDVVRAVEEEGDGKWITVDFAEGIGSETLDRKEARDAHPSILRTYGILRDRNL